MNYLKWIAVLPTFVGGIVVGILGANLFFFFQSWWLGVGADSGWAFLHNYVFASAIGSVLGVYWGTKIAPSHTKVVAFVLGALLVVVYVSDVIMGFVLSNPDATGSVVRAVVSVIAGGYVVCCMSQDAWWWC